MAALECPRCANLQSVDEDVESYVCIKCGAANQVTIPGGTLLRPAGTRTFACPKCKTPSNVKSEAPSYLCGGCRSKWFVDEVCGKCGNSPQVSESWLAWNCKKCGQGNPNPHYVRAQTSLSEAPPAMTDGKVKSAKSPAAARAGAVGVLVVLAAVIWVSCSTLSGGGDVTGRFIRWEPIDSRHGYALISVTNHGDKSAHVTCTVEVSNDFGDFGFDAIDEDIGPGQTTQGRVALVVQNEGALSVIHGEVKDC